MQAYQTEKLLPLSSFDEKKKEMSFLICFYSRSFLKIKKSNICLL